MRRTTRAWCIGDPQIIFLIFLIFLIFTFCVTTLPQISHTHLPLSYEGEGWMVLQGYRQGGHGYSYGLNCDSTLVCSTLQHYIYRYVGISLGNPLCDVRWCPPPPPTCSSSRYIYLYMSIAVCICICMHLPHIDVSPPPPNISRAQEMRKMM